MRNASVSFSHNATGDIRLREIIFGGNISETTRASNFKLYHRVALDSLYISTRNDIIICFRSMQWACINFFGTSSSKYNVLQTTVALR